ncbi:hypothetical protein AAC387_Pa04g0547 [Persea americana]
MKWFLMLFFGCLLVFGTIQSDVIAREISGGFLGGKRRLEASSASVNLVKCRSKKIDLCGFSRPFNRNSTLEDKRRVPTGPNPLHNR